MTQFRRVFSKTSELFWQHPWLWLPVLVADACHVMYSSAAELILRQVVYVLTPHSVLGGYGDFENGLPTAAIIAISTIKFSTHLFGIAIYLYALGVLARAVPAAQADAGPRSALKLRVPEGWLAALISVFGWLVPVILIWLTTTYFLTTHLQGIDPLYVWIGIGGLAAAVYAYLIAPALRRLIDRNGPARPPLTAAWLEDGGLFFFGIAVSSAVYLAMRYALQHDQQLPLVANHAVWFFLWLFVSLVASMPYTFAMIGLAMREPELGLFVYGTLHPDRAPEPIREVVAHFRLIGQGTVTGQLLNLGEYPGVILNGAQATIPGTVFAVPGDPTIWHALDTYEGFDPNDLAASLFRREQIAATMEDGTQRQCWIYLYNQPVPAV